MNRHILNLKITAWFPAKPCACTHKMVDPAPGDAPNRGAEYIAVTSIGANRKAVWNHWAVLPPERSKAVTTLLG